MGVGHWTYDNNLKDEFIKKCPSGLEIQHSKTLEGQVAQQSTPQKPPS